MVAGSQPEVLSVADGKAVGTGVVGAAVGAFVMVAVKSVFVRASLSTSSAIFAYSEIDTVDPTAKK